jgi:hypothetical protein
MFENKVVKKLFGLPKDEISEEIRTLNNKKRLALYRKRTVTCRRCEGRMKCVENSGETS